MNDNEKNNNFSVTGLPSNDPFEVEVPDTNKRAISRSKSNDLKAQLEKELKNLTPETLMKQLPPEKLAELQEEADANGISLEEAFSASLGALNQALNGGFNDLFSGLENAINELMGAMGEEEKQQENEEESESTSERYMLSDSDYLHPEEFGSIKCNPSESLYNDFVEKFGTDSTKYFDEATGITSLIYSDVTIKLIDYPIKSWKYITSTNDVILFYAEPVDEKKYGYFIAVVNGGDNDGFTAFIPEFGNTFKVSEDGTVGLYGPESDPDFFETDNNGNAKFVMLNLSTLLFSTQFYLAPYKNVILNPKKFGTIKNVIAPITKPSCMLKIGNIISNESPEAILLKKDADLPLEDTVFPLYIHFGGTISEYSLKVIQQILFKVDFNKCKIFDYCELKWTPDKRLYVDIDLGEF